VRTAIKIADAEGPDAITMRRIARELGAGAMSLYWHVDSKEELLDAMIEQLEHEVGLPEPTGDWRADLRTLAHRQRAAWLRHPWVIEFIGSRPPSGPNDAHKFEMSLAIYDPLELDPQTLLSVHMTIAMYILGAVTREMQERRSHAIEAAAEADMSEEELKADRERVATWFHESGRYPRILRILESGIDPDDPATRDARFDFGFECVLDGIAARLGRTG
jgi:AcrR family transcriptional regulator